MGRRVQVRAGVLAGMQFISAPQGSVVVEIAHRLSVAAIVFANGSGNHSTGVVELNGAVRSMISMDWVPILASS